MFVLFVVMNILIYLLSFSLSFCWSELTLGSKSILSVLCGVLVFTLIYTSHVAVLELGYSVEGGLILNGICLAMGFAFGEGLRKLT